MSGRAVTLLALGLLLAGCAMPPAAARDKAGGEVYANASATCQQSAERQARAELPPGLDAPPPTIDRTSGIVRERRQEAEREAELRRKARVHELYVACMRRLGLPPQ